jgi:plasmid stabilization system protein ParE
VSAPRHRKPRKEPEKEAPALRWTHRAEKDLENIGDYIAEDDPVAALRWVGLLLEKARLAAQLPGVGRVVPELGRADVREVLLRSYRIVYRVRGRDVEVLTVFEGHQLFPTNLDVDDELP